MKRFIQILGLSWYMICASILQGHAQVATDTSRARSCNKPANIDNPALFATYDEAKTYITNFRQKFARGKKRKNIHSRSAYFSKATFCFIDSFLKDKDNDLYTEIQITLADYNEIYLPYQHDPRQTTLYFTPVRNDGITDYDTFYNYANTHAGSITCDKAYTLEKEVIVTANHGELCPEKCDATTGDWGPSIKNRMTTQSPAARPVPSAEFLTPEEAKIFTTNYRKYHCRLSKRKHTKAVFLNRANFRFIGEFFKTHPMYDAIRVYFVSYDENGRVAGQERKRQMSLLLAPASGLNGEPDFCAFSDYLNSGNYSGGASLTGTHQIRLSTAVIF